MGTQLWIQLLRGRDRQQNASAYTLWGKDYRDTKARQRQNYTLISMMSVNTKILIKILLKQLELHINKIILFVQVVQRDLIFKNQQRQYSTSAKDEQNP